MYKIIGRSSFTVVINHKIVNQHAKQRVSKQGQLKVRKQE